MVAVFFAFVVAGAPSLKELGTGLGVAILLDATLVRLLIVPAAMRLLGHWNWWMPAARPACFRLLRTNLGAMRILVSGGAGFIGSHFVKRLPRAGDDVVVLDKLTYSGNRANLPDDVEFHEATSPSPHDVARAAAAATRSSTSPPRRTSTARSSPPRTSAARSSAARRCCSSTCARRASRLVQVSTDEVYGDLEAGGSSKETDPLRPSSPYSAAKAAGDLLVPAYARTFGVNASITRGSNTYGPNQYPEKFIPLFVTNALDGQPLPLYGDGTQIRDWLFVEDHCAGIEFVLHEGAPGEVYNVGGGDEHENIDVAERIIELTGADRSLLRRVPGPPGHDRRYSLDTSKLRGLGWAPQSRSTRASARPSSGTATTAPGGSRSSPASTASTTSGSTPGGSRLTASSRALAAPA